MNEPIKEVQREFQSGDYYKKTKRKNKGRQEFPADAPKPTVNQSGPNLRLPGAATPSTNTPNHFCFSETGLSGANKHKLRLPPSFAETGNVGLRGPGVGRWRVLLRRGGTGPATNASINHRNATDMYCSDTQRALFKRWWRGCL